MTQANEILHEESFGLLRMLPVIYPNYYGYLLPYYILFNDVLVHQEWRLRIVPLSISTRTIGDGVEFAPNMNSKGKFKLLVALPYNSTLAKGFNIGLGLYRSFQNRFKIVYTPKPVFRYSAIFAKSISNKFDFHTILYRNLWRYKAITEKQKRINKNSNLWVKLAKQAQKVGLVNSRVINIIGMEEHPKIMKQLLNVDSYMIRREVIKDILKIR